MDIPRDLITATEARRLLGISPTTMSRLFRDGVLPTSPDRPTNPKKLLRKAPSKGPKMRRAEAQ